MHRLSVSLVFGLLACAAALGNENHGIGYSVLDDEVHPLLRDFNDAKGKVRLLFVVDPTCPQCLRGLDDMNRSLLASTHSAHLQTFVVHMPVVGAKPEDIGAAAKLLQNPAVRHYWNASGEFGRLLSQAVGLEQDGKQVYAWDVWLLYGPEAVCDESGPPQPRLLMQQLRDLKGSKKFPRLDSDVFAREARALLAAAVPKDAAK